MTERPRVVIIGGGFGGTYTARFLKRAVRRREISVTLINRTNYFLFTPLLHEVATGGISPILIAEPLREIFRQSGLNILETNVIGVDPTRRVVTTTSGEVSYDYLVVSAGAETNFYNIPGAREHSLVLKNLFDAVMIRDRVIESFERARSASAKDEAKLLSFVVVGGGATGVELAAELAELVYDTLCSYYGRLSRICHSAQVTLVSSDQEVLKQFPLSLRRAAVLVLARKRVNLRLGAVVTAVTDNQIEFKNSAPLSTTNVFWAAGVKSTAIDLPGVERCSDGRIMIDSFLQATKLKRIFVVGDMAAFIEKKDGQPLPMLAQVAVEQARVLAKNIMASINGTTFQPFRYHSRGSLVSLGQWYAVGEIFGFPIHGRIAWWIWRTVYLFKFHSWRKRFKIALDWTIGLFSSRDITKVR